MKIIRINRTEDRQLVGQLDCEACEAKGAASLRLTSEEIGESDICEACLPDNIGKKMAQEVLKRLKTEYDVRIKD